MQVFDASSMIYAWNNYPINQFPGMWEWMTTQIKEQKLVMPDVAFKEVTNKTPELGNWLEKNNVTQLKITNDIIQDAMRIKKLLGIDGDKYRAKGVGENDLFIIAAARANGKALVSDENKQKILPQKHANMKIPAVCAMEAVEVSCINFLTFIKDSGQIFR